MMVSRQRLRKPSGWQHSLLGGRCWQSKPECGLESARCELANMMIPRISHNCFRINADLKTNVGASTPKTRRRGRGQGSAPSFSIGAR